MAKKIVSIQLSEDLLNLLKKDAEEEFLTLSAFIRKLLMQHYKEIGKWDIFIK